MSNPATPLDNKEAVAQISRSINFLISNFLLPTARQTAANASAIAKTNQGINQLKKSLEIQRDVSDDTAEETVILEHRANYSETAVEALRRDAIEDRNKAENDRQRWQTNFDNQLAEIRALGEQNRALLSALATTNRRIDNLEHTG